jgi:hypothetical protein
MMVDVEPVHESRDTDRAGAGDHNCEFEFGHPRACLTAMQCARLLIMRGYILDVSHAPPSIRGHLRFGGDDDHVTRAPSGLFVPPDYALWGDDS